MILRNYFPCFLDLLKCRENNANVCNSNLLHWNRLLTTTGTYVHISYIIQAVVCLYSEIHCLHSAIVTKQVGQYALRLFSSVA